MNAFPIDIEKDQLVGHLKDAIKAKNENDFAGVDAVKIKLWNVKISDDRNDLLSNLSLQNKDELLATREIGDYWTEKPPKRHIHVLVEPPATATASSCEQELLDELTSLRALINKSVHGMYLFLT